MSASTQSLGQSLFDFLDGKDFLQHPGGFQGGALAQEIRRYVDDQLERFHIGSFHDALGHPGAHSLRNDPVVFGAHTDHGGRPDLVGGQQQVVHAQVDLTSSLGGIADMWLGEGQAESPMFRSHRG
jgi:hypothetical protein